MNCLYQLWFYDQHWKDKGNVPTCSWEAVPRANSDRERTAVDKFTYLGSTLSRSVHIDDETDARIAKASVAFGHLHSSVWERKGVSLSTKLSVYRAIALTTLLYACETWTGNLTVSISTVFANC